MEQQADRQFKSRVVYLLILIAFMQTIYPVTANGNAFILIGYQLLIAGLVVTGIMLAPEGDWKRSALIGVGVLWALAGAAYAFNQEILWLQVPTYVTLITFHCLVIWIMLRYIFGAREVTRDVLYAASAVYLLLGAVFVSLYGMLDLLTFAQTGASAFADGTVPPGTIFPWQNLIYYSYATLTTLGYGDVLPVTLWARSFATAEAVVGVLYITIIMARLVGLYAATDVEQQFQKDL